MSNQSCGFFCFKDCGDKYETHIMKKEVEPAEKLSLKKVNAVHPHPQDTRRHLQRIKSASKM